MVYYLELCYLYNYSSIDHLSCMHRIVISILYLHPSRQHSHLSQTKRYTFHCFTPQNHIIHPMWASTPLVYIMYTLFLTVWLCIIFLKYVVMCILVLFGLEYYVLVFNFESFSWFFSYISRFRFSLVWTISLVLV